MAAVTICCDFQFSSVAQSCLTLCDPMNCSPQAALSMGFPREYWSGWSFPSPGELPDPGIEPTSPELQVDSCTTEPPGKPRYMDIYIDIWSISWWSHLQFPGRGKATPYLLPWECPASAPPDLPQNTRLFRSGSTTLARGISSST